MYEYIREFRIQEFNFSQKKVFVYMLKKNVLFIYSNTLSSYNIYNISYNMQFRK